MLGAPVPRAPAPDVDAEDLVTDFETALQAKLARNRELAEQRAQAEQEMDRAAEAASQAAAERAAAAAAARAERYDELVAHLRTVAAQLKASEPESFIVRVGFTTEHADQLVARISTRLVEPARTLFLELDRDDDEVLARWSGDLGQSLELWRLLEVTPEMLTELVLAVADQDAWRSRTSPPPFPGADPALDLG